MSRPQIIEIDGEPAFAVVPWAEWRARQDFAEKAAMSDEEIAERALARIETGEEVWPAELVNRLLDGDNAVKVFREHRGMTQAELAAAAGIATAYLGQIEQGVRGGGLGTLRKLATALRVDLEHLLPPHRDERTDQVQPIDLQTVQRMVSPLPTEAAAKLAFYVYVLIDPRTKKPFYVGKGTGNRWFDHIRDAATGVQTRKARVIHDILLSGRPPDVVIHRHGLDEATALAIEAALIDVYGLQSLLSEIHGHGVEFGRASVDEIRDRYAATPLDVPEGTRSVFLKVDRYWSRALSAEELYECTRMYWPGRPRQTRVGAVACAVAGGLVREVYQIERMLLFPAGQVIQPNMLRGDDEWSPSKDKWGFDGTVSTHHRDWIGKSVHHLSWPAEGGVKVLNC